MLTTVVVGNPKRGSRTRAAGERVAEAFSGRPADHVIEVVDLGPALLEWGDEGISAAVDLVARSDLVVIASPTYKATYTGLLKTFLDKFAGGTGMQGVVAVPLMVGGAWNHALARRADPEARAGGTGGDNSTARPIPHRIGVRGGRPDR